MSASKTTNVEVRLPARVGIEKVAANTIVSVATLMGFRENRVRALKTAVSEACINAIEHSIHPNEVLTVRVVLPDDRDSSNPEMPA
jgi:serine/threonine-protein kinase RsbW